MTKHKTIKPWFIIGLALSLQYNSASAQYKQTAYQYDVSETGVHSDTTIKSIKHYDRDSVLLSNLVYDYVDYGIVEIHETYNEGKKRSSIIKIPEKNFESTTLFDRDSMGNITAQHFINKDTFSLTHTNIYNAQGKIIETQMYAKGPNAPTGSIGLMEWTYHPNGEIATLKTYEMNKLSKEDKYIYDSLGQTIEEEYIYHNENSIDTTKVINTYNEIGQIVETITYDDQIAQSQKITWDNKVMQQIIITFPNSEATSILYYTYETTK